MLWPAATRAGSLCTSTACHNARRAATDRPQQREAITRAAIRDDISPEQRAQMERDIADFYAKHGLVPAPAAPEVALQKFPFTQSEARSGKI